MLYFLLKKRVCKTQRIKKREMNLFFVEKFLNFISKIFKIFLKLKTYLGFETFNIKL